jgi:hypothetical protein
MPVISASFIARIRWTRALAASPVIAAGLRPGQSRLAVRRDRELQGDVRAAVAHAAEMPRMGAPRLLGADADLDRDAMLAQPRMPLAGNRRVRILQRRDDARDARRHDGLDAGRGLAVVRTGLERGVERRAACRVAGPPQRLDLGMRPPARLGPAAPDHDAVAHHHGADGRVRPGIAEPAPPERQRQAHEACIEVRAHPGWLLSRSLEKLPGWHRTYRPFNRDLAICSSIAAPTSSSV